MLEAEIDDDCIDNDADYIDGDGIDSREEEDLVDSDSDGYVSGEEGGTLSGTEEDSIGYNL